MCLQVLFFAPVNLLEPEQSFYRFAGRLIVSPVVRVLVFSKVNTQDSDVHLDKLLFTFRTLFFPCFACLAIVSLVICLLVSPVFLQGEAGSSQRRTLAHMSSMLP